MYQLMAAHWPTADEDPTAPPYIVEYARTWKRVSKIVVSRSLERVEWNSRLLKDNVVAEIARLKAEPGRSMSIGGAELAATLADSGLIDEYRLYFIPVFLGGGKPVLRQLRERVNLSLVEVHQFTAGVVLLRYRRANIHS